MSTSGLLISSSNFVIAIGNGFISMSLNNISKFPVDIAACRRMRLKRLNDNVSTYIGKRAMLL